MGDERPAAAAGLQFERAEFEQAAPAGVTCAHCQQAVADEYYELRGRMLCGRCRHELAAALAGGSPLGRFVRASVFGIGGGLAGSILWYSVRTLTESQWGLIAILVGWLVGGGVRAGSRARGGWLYQSLAVGLTYLAIASNYLPDVFEALGRAGGGEPLPAPLRLIAALLIAMAAPFLGGFKNIIGLLIIGFGLYQAWKMNARVELRIAGPFRVSQPARLPADPLA